MDNSGLDDIQHPCLYCKKEIPDWRTNKKFCNEACKTDFHNQQRDIVDKEMKKVHKILNTNYEILKKVIGDNPHAKIDRKELERRGFRFDFLTQIKGDYHNCYALSWRAIEGSMVLISRVPKSTYSGGS